MAAPGYQLVNYPVYGFGQPVSYNVAALNVLQFTYPTVPQGQVWTVSFLPCQFNAPQTGGMEDVLWSMYRNDVAELTWFGNTMVRDVQLLGGDRIYLVATNVPTSNAMVPSFTATQLLVTMRGFAVPAGQDVPSRPSFSGAGEGQWLLGYDPGTVTLSTTFPTANGSLVFALPSGQSALVGLCASLSAHGGGTAMSGAVNVQDSSGGILWEQPVVLTNAAASWGTALWVPLNQYSIPPGSALLLTWTGFVANGANCDVVVYFNAY